MQLLCIDQSVLHFQHERVVVIIQPTMCQFAILRLNVHTLVDFLTPFRSAP